MSRSIINIIIFLFFIQSVYAADVPQIESPTQRQDQQLCVQQRLSRCLETCNKSDNMDCPAICQENVKNECLQAGE